MNGILEHLGLVTHGTEEAWAVTSMDDAYRYLLGRRWKRGPVWVWGAMNPSTARHDKSDHSMTKMVGFTDRGGGGAIAIVNMLAYSATDPQDMVRAMRDGVDVVGAHNLAAIDWALHLAAGDPGARKLAAWGKIPKPCLVRATRSIIRFKKCEPDCLGVNADGTPRHPLTLSYATPIVRLSTARAA